MFVSSVLTVEGRDELAPLGRQSFINGFNTQPCPRRYAAGIKRTLGTAQHKKQALLAKDIRRLIAACPKNLSGTRDKALFLLSFAGAFRRSESSGLTVEDLKFCREGVVSTLRHSKTDQEHAGREVGIPYAKDMSICPVFALKEWLKAAKIKTGPVLRRVDRYEYVSKRRGLDPASVTYFVKQAARCAGFQHISEVSGNSFRLGHVSQAVRNGVPEYVVMKQTRQKSREVLGAYIRTEEIFEQNAVASLWAGLRPARAGRAYEKAKFLEECQSDPFPVRGEVNSDNFGGALLHFEVIAACKPNSKLGRSYAVLFHKVSEAFPTVFCMRHIQLAHLSLREPADSHILFCKPIQHAFTVGPRHQTAKGK